ncbi:carbohydrate-binding module family 13 protein [Backusella circina FSU 941]|nr:carbohydrate-binding module family 13 protein [Backusella circina FSU 941]
MDVFMGETTPDSNVIIWPQKPSNDQENQLWRYDDGFLTNKKSGLVMDIRGGDLQAEKTIVQYERKMTMAHNQRFGYRDGFIYCLADPRLVLDIKGGGKKDGTKIILYKRKDSHNDNQKWDIIPIGEPIGNMLPPARQQQPSYGYSRQDAHPQGYGNQHRPISGGTIPYYPPPAGHRPSGYGPPDDENARYR